MLINTSLLPPQEQPIGVATAFERWLDPYPTLGPTREGGGGVGAGYTLWRAAAIIRGFDGIQCSVRKGKSVHDTCCCCRSEEHTSELQSPA